MNICQRCKKAPNIGIDSTHNYGGGWSMRGQRTRNVWKPNLHEMRINMNGRMVKMRLCTKCTRIVKAEANAKFVGKKAANATPVSA